MICRKCSGRMFVDRVFSSGQKIDIACLLCGQRVFVDRDTNSFGKWLNKKEKDHRAEYIS